MKFFFFFVLVIFSQSSAQFLDFEVLRSTESPGFFGIKLAPNPTTQPIEMADIFIINYSLGEVSVYAPLNEAIRLRGDELLTVNDFSSGNYTNDAHRIVYLGGKSPSKNYLHFTSEGGDILREFAVFVNQNLSPIYATNITLDFGGVASDIYPVTIPPLTDKPLMIVGRFKRPMRARMQMTAETALGVVSGTSVIDLRVATAEPSSAQLEETWNHLREESALSKFQFWAQYQKIIVITLGVLVIFFVIIFIIKRFVNKTSDDFDDFLISPDSPSNISSKPNPTTLRTPTPSVKSSVTSAKTPTSFQPRTRAQSPENTSLTPSQKVSSKTAPPESQGS